MYLSIFFFLEKDSMLSVSFIFKINLTENMKQLDFELGSRILTIKLFATCARDV